MAPVPILALFAALQAAAPGATGPAPVSSVGATPAPPVVTPVRKEHDADKVVCRHSAETGSRLSGVTECATKAQWRERERTNADTVRQVQSKALQLRP